MTDNVTPTLKPCPFCGGEVHLDHSAEKGGMYGPEGNHEAGCLLKSFDFCDYGEAMAAVAAWNDRRTPACPLCDGTGYRDYAGFCMDPCVCAIATQAAEIARLREALVEHNERLRSAVAIASRDGKATNWLAFRGQCRMTLAEYHDIVTNSRASISTQPDDQGDFQAEVGKWMLACFGEEIPSDQLERADRFTEEALELAQTMPGFTADRAHALVDYVFGRDVGERGQEVGGVMVTLAALCNAAGIAIETEAQRELARAWTKVDAIRAKQAAKPTGSALPMADDQGVGKSS